MSAIAALRICFCFLEITYLRSPAKWWLFIQENTFHVLVTVFEASLIRKCLIPHFISTSPVLMTDRFFQWQFWPKFSFNPISNMWPSRALNLLSRLQISIAAELPFFSDHECPGNLIQTYTQRTRSQWQLSIIFKINTVLGHSTSSFAGIIWETAAQSLINALSLI